MSAIRSTFWSAVSLAVARLLTKQPPGAFSSAKASQFLRKVNERTQRAEWDLRPAPNAHHDLQSQTALLQDAVFLRRLNFGGRNRPEPRELLGKIGDIPMTRYLDKAPGTAVPPAPTMTTKVRTNSRVRTVLWWMMAAIIVLAAAALFMSHTI